MSRDAMPANRVVAAENQEQQRYLRDKDVAVTGRSRERTRQLAVTCEN